MSEPLVRVQALEKRFGARRALQGIDLEVGVGETVGLVGPNGSGKTTLLRILAGLLAPDAGSVRVLGHDPWSARARVMERVRFAFAPPALFETLTAREHLRHLARLGAAADGRGEATEAEVERTLATVGLGARADERVRAFSFGMRQRLALAQALLPRPELLVLDEPTEGLDPLAILELRALLARLRAEHGLALLLSSHLLVEIDHLVDRLVVLNEGRVVFAGTPAELRTGGARLVLRAADPVRARERLRAAGHEASENGAGELELAPGALTLEEARDCLGAGELLGFHLREATLEAARLERLRGESRA